MMTERSSDNGIQNRHRRRHAGFDHRLVKPVDLAALQTLLAGSRGAAAEA